MKNLKHTKGEWRYSELYQVITDEEGYSIAQESGLKHSKDWEANAKLISAAPDLLEALILANKLIDELDKASDYRETEFHYETQHKINNAINKATK